MAESVAYYVMGGSIIEKDGKKVYSVEGYTNTMDIDRYNFIKEKIMGGKEYLTTYTGGEIKI